MSEDSFSVDDVGSAEGDAFVTTRFDEGSVGFADALGNVGDHGDVHGAEATFSTGFLGVFHVSEVGVNRGSDDLASDLLEFSSGVGELADFSGTHEGEIEGPEKENRVLAYDKEKCLILISLLTFKLFKRDFLELVVPPGLGLESGSGVSDARSGDSCGFHK